MVPDHFIDHEPDELLAKVGIELGFFCQLAQPGNLPLFAQWIAWWKRVFGLVGTHRLGNAEAFGEHVDQRGVDIVYRGAEAGERGIGVGVGLGICHRQSR